MALLLGSTIAVLLDPILWLLAALVALIIRNQKVALKVKIAVGLGLTYAIASEMALNSMQFARTFHANIFLIKAVLDVLVFTVTTMLIRPKVKTGQ